MALTSASTDAEVIAQYENSARYWESYAKACDFCEAIVFILNRFNRVNALAGKSWTREDLTALLNRAEEKRTALATTGTIGAQVHFAAGRAL
jgi:hypothetical protein